MNKKNLLVALLLVPAFCLSAVTGLSIAVADSAVTTSGNFVFGGTGGDSIGSMPLVAGSKEMMAGGTGGDTIGSMPLMADSKDLMAGGTGGDSIGSMPLIAGSKVMLAGGGGDSIGSIPKVCDPVLE